jgi:2-deoxy-D-gluconate 3-dehydrogenase
MTAPPLFDLSGRRALVTGGGGGMGLGISKALAGAGAEVAVLGRSAAADDAAARVGGTAVRADLSDRDGLRQGFEDAVESLGGLEIVVASHGTLHAGPALETSLDGWDETIEVNLRSVFELCRLAGELMVPSRSGEDRHDRVDAELPGWIPRRRVHRLEGWPGAADEGARERMGAPRGQRQRDRPGYVKTPLDSHIWRDDAERSEALLARLPAGRWGEPADLAGAVVFVSSAASDYVHGIVLPVDGGWLAR